MGDPSPAHKAPAPHSPCQQRAPGTLSSPSPLAPSHPSPTASQQLQVHFHLALTDTSRHALSVHLSVQPRGTACSQSAPMPPASPPVGNSCVRRATVELLGHPGDTRCDPIKGSCTMPRGRNALQRTQQGNHSQTLPEAPVKPKSPLKVLASPLPSLHAVSQEQHTAQSASLLWGR